MFERFKKFTCMTLVVATVLTSMVPVYAANTKDKAFRFTSSSEYNYTAARSKKDTSPVYVCVDSSRAKAKIQAYGYITTSDGDNVWVNCTNAVNGKKEVTAKPGVKSSIHTGIYEKGGRSAKLKGRSTSSTEISAGVWSPDSTKTYNELN